MFFVNFIDSFECDLSTFFGGWECAMLMWDMILSKCLHLNMNSCCLFNAIINTHLHLHFLPDCTYFVCESINEKLCKTISFLFNIQQMINENFRATENDFHTSYFDNFFFSQRKKQKFQEDKKKDEFWICNWSPSSPPAQD